MLSNTSGFSRIRSNESGFTLIELMIVVAILAILMAIAIPAYQDYTIRAQVTEGMNLADGAKSAVWDYWSSRGKFPDDNTEAGLPNAESITGEYVSKVEIDDKGQITVEFKADSTNRAIRNETLILKALGDADDASMAWSCSEGTIPAKYLPTRCRS